MRKLRIALIEDEEIFLNDRKEDLEELEGIEVVFTASSANSFMEQWKALTNPLDALVTDIDLGSQYTGIDIAMKVNKPTFFISGFTKEHLESIEQLEDNVSIVEHLSKPFSTERFKNRMLDFCRKIRLNLKEELTITLKGEYNRSIQVLVRDIVYLQTDKNHGASSGNKRIYFTNRAPLTLNDFSFSRIADWGSEDDCFVQIHKSTYVNHRHCEKIEREKGKFHIVVTFVDDKGEEKTDSLPVSESYYRNIKKY